MPDNQSRITSIVFDPRTVSNAPSQKSIGVLSVSLSSVADMAAHMEVKTEPVSANAGPDPYDVEVQGIAHVKSQERGNFVLFISKQDDAAGTISLNIMSTDNGAVKESFSFSLTDLCGHVKDIMNKEFQKIDDQKRETSLPEFLKAAAPAMKAAMEKGQTAEREFLKGALAPHIDANEEFYGFFQQNFDAVFATDIMKHALSPDIPVSGLQSKPKVFGH